MHLKKQAKEYLHLLRRKWNYSHDLLDEKGLDKFKKIEAELADIAKSKEPSEKSEKFLHQLPGQLNKLFPGTDSLNGWTENIEVLFVAVVIALALRTYFVQPFKIPTHSMRPTLWGIYQEPDNQPSPNILTQVIDFTLFGKSHHRFVAPEDGSVESLEPWRPLPFFTFTKLNFNGHEYHLLTEPQNVLACVPEINLERKYRAGDVVANFSVQAGDHIFVNKMTYNFRLPKQGEVFVFTTKDIAGLQGQTSGVTQYYIKRCVGVPGTTLRIDEPYLYSNGQQLHSKAFDRNYARQGGYNGYVHASQAHYLLTAQDEVSIPENSYWAMGDNSRNSLDSRYWKFVPRENLVGTALLVYWPLTKRWGFVD